MDKAEERVYRLALYYYFHDKNIYIMTIFLATPHIDTKRLWQKSSEKIAQFLPLLLKGVYEGYGNDNVK